MNNRLLIPYFFGIDNAIQVDQYVVKMDAGWYPYEIDRKTKAISFVKKKFLSIEPSPGYVHIHFLTKTSAEFLTKIRDNSQVYKKYTWGEALVLQPSFYKDVLKFSSGNSSLTFFVPELNAMIDVLELENLENIQLLTTLDLTHDEIGPDKTN